MRIAFISYELPPDTALGGIATYVAQVSRCLAQAGHDVEVFCGSTTRAEQVRDDSGVLVNRIKADRHIFPTAIVPAFLQRHRADAFDVLEGPDFLAEARYVVRALPQLPYVVKLHTPYYFAAKYSQFPITGEHVRNNLRLFWYALKTRNLRALDNPVNPIFREERQHLLQADEIVAPSQSIGQMIVRTWGADPARVSLVPYTYEPSPEMLAIPADTETQRVSFIGRLEWRKGVQDLVPAIPLILDAHPKARFSFVGAFGASPYAGVNMKEFICRRVPRRLLDRIEFTGKVPLNSIPQYLAKTDICVYPSRWESFGFVVLEAMAAARGIVCTDNGGMAELIERGEYGLMVPPKSPREIAKRVNFLLAHPQIRQEFGTRARQRGLQRFAPSSVIPRQLASYERAIARRRSTASLALSLGAQTTS